MYFLYGPYHQLILALHDGVRTFAGLGKGREGAKFVSDGQTRQLPKPPTVYGIGGLREKWTPIVRRFAESLDRRILSLRYRRAFSCTHPPTLHPHPHHPLTTNS